MTSKRTMRAGPVPARIFLKAAGAAAALMVTATPVAASASSMAPAKATTPAPRSSIIDFYRARDGQPLWLAPEAGNAAEQLIQLLREAELDGLDPASFGVSELERAVRAAWGGDKKSVDRAEAMLSQAFVAYVHDLRRVPDIGVIYVDRELRPVRPSPRQLLETAGKAPSLGDYVTRMGWMHPTYAQLRTALQGERYASAAERQRLELNLERARALPATARRYVLVNTAAQRLYMYEDGKVVDSMRVVVGKPKHPTPMMAAFIRYSSLNPYWNVPPDLAAERVAPNVLKDGVGYLDEKGYQVLSDWGNDPDVVDPTTVDWKAVADGRIELRVRQLPGPNNAMGQMKFMFPNKEGIYLHDTPERELLSEASRLFSGGCVRLEDAPRLARWLHGQSLEPEGAQPEQRVPLREPIPVYLTYLTAEPSGSEITYFDDIYGRDAARLAQLNGSGRTASR